MTATDEHPADRLATRYAMLKLSAAAMDDLFATLEAAREHLRKLRPAGEDPKAHAVGAFLVGWDFHAAAASRIDPRRRGEVMRTAYEWLPDVAALTDTEYRMTVAVWASRTKAARASAAEHFAPKVRA